MSTVRWSDIRDKHIDAIGREENGELSGIDASTTPSPPSEASWKSSPTSATNISRSAEHRR